MSAINVAVNFDKTKDTLWDWPLQDDFVHLHEDNKHIEVGLDAKYFTQQEIEVKAIGDLVEIHLEHKARKDAKLPQGMVSRTINRCYQMPKGVDMKSLKSEVDSQGILHITANKFA